MNARSDRKTGWTPRSDGACRHPGNEILISMCQREMSDRESVHEEGSLWEPSYPRSFDQKCGERGAKLTKECGNAVEKASGTFSVSYVSGNDVLPVGKAQKWKGNTFIWRETFQVCDIFLSKIIDCLLQDWVYFPTRRNRTYVHRGKRIFLLYPCLFCLAAVVL